MDLKNQIEVLKIVKETIKHRDMAAVVVMHDLNLALRFSGRFLLLKGGTVFACGEMEVMIEESVREVYGIPVKMEKVYGVPVVMPI